MSSTQWDSTMDDTVDNDISDTEYGETTTNDLTGPTHKVPAPRQHIQSTDYEYDEDDSESDEGVSNDDEEDGEGSWDER